MSGGTRAPRFDRSAIRVACGALCVEEGFCKGLRFTGAADVVRWLEETTGTSHRLRTIQHRLQVCVAEGVIEARPEGGWRPVGRAGATMSEAATDNERSK